MTVTEMWLAIGGGTCLLIILFSLIKIKPLEINVWSWILRKMGKAFQGEMLDTLSGINDTVATLDTKIDTLDSKVDGIQGENEKNRIDDIRRDIVIFADSIRNFPHHQSREHFEQVIELIDIYSSYCKTHETYENNKADMAIELVKEEYQRQIEQNYI